MESATKDSVAAGNSKLVPMNQAYQDEPLAFGQQQLTPRTASSTGAGSEGDANSRAPFVCAVPSRPWAHPVGSPGLTRVSSGSQFAVRSQSQMNDGLVTIVKRDVEMSENRIRNEINKFRDMVTSSMNKMDKGRETSLQRIEQKISSYEAMQCKIDRKVSELSGAVRGLSDEMQLQIRRADTVDTRLWDFRHQLEENFQRRFAEIDAQSNEIITKSKAVSCNNEDVARQFQIAVAKLDGQVQNLLKQHDHVDQAIDGFEHRLGQVENAYDGGNCQAPGARLELEARQATDEGDERIWHVEQQLQDVGHRIEQFVRQAHSDRGWDARLEEHEVRMNSMRSKLETVEELYQALDERMRSEMESRLQQVQRNIQDIGCRSFDDATRLDTLTARADNIEQVVDAMREGVIPMGHSSGQSPFLQATLEALAPANLSAHSTEPTFGAQVRPGDLDVPEMSVEDTIDKSAQDQILSAGFSFEPEGSTDAVFDAGSPTPSVGGTNQIMEAGDELDIFGIRLNQLVEQLKGVVPKILEHDELIKNLTADTCASSLTQRAAEAAERSAEEAKALANDALSELEAYKSARTVEATTAVQQNPTPNDDAFEKVRRRCSAIEKDVQKHIQVQGEALQKLHGAVTCIAEQLEDLHIAAATSEKCPTSTWDEFPDANDNRCSELAARAAPPGEPDMKSWAVAAGLLNATPRGASEPVMDERLADLFQSVEESEVAVAKIQEKLNMRIQKMDSLLHAVTKDVCKEGDTQIKDSVPLSGKLLDNAQVSSDSPVKPDANENIIAARASYRF